MLSRWPIRYKMLVGVSLLVLIVGTLATSGFRGVYAYRGLVRSMRQLVLERPRARDIAQRVSELQIAFGEIRSPHNVSIESNDTSPLSLVQFRTKVKQVEEALDNYSQQLEQNQQEERSIGDNRQEWDTVLKMAGLLDNVAQLNQDQAWWLEELNISSLTDQLIELNRLSNQLPEYQDARVTRFTLDVRSQYRTWIALMWVTVVAASLLLVLLGRFFFVWVIQPLRLLVNGSRYVACGNFQHRIQLNTDDEMSELAEAMNAMTKRFQCIRDHLDRQVELRTKQVVRSEQLASVGFLAAGVAHEINNPLQSIAICAEALEIRLHEIIQDDDAKDDDEHNEEITVTRNYLRMIQDEAFRCKQITETLLDFSRKGDAERHDIDLCELVQSVIDMVGHVGQYKDKRIEFHADQSVLVSINPQEIKQVVLNIVTNGLDSVEAGGTVDIEVKQSEGRAQLFFADDGCGMTEEVLQHLFDPFFTKRRDGKGTGLGLSISYRIVDEHGGTIDVASEGPGYGSQFYVSLPLQKEKDNQYQAA